MATTEIIIEDAKIENITRSNPFFNNQENIEWLRFEPEGTEELYRKPIKYLQDGTELDYTISEGDQMDKIAYQFYKNIVDNPEQWAWLIAEVNDLDQYLDLSEFVGLNLMIPDPRRISN